MEDIESGLLALAAVIKERGIRSIAITPVGSGLGGLSWPQVRTRIEDVLGKLESVRILVYEPDPAHSTLIHARTAEEPKITSGRAALVVLMDRYLAGLLDPFVSLLEVHKLMYFLQEAGEPLRLSFVKAPYGPYAENLRHVLRAVEGHLVTGYSDGGDAPDKQLALVPGAVEDARNFVEQHEQTKARLMRVTELVAGFESPFGLELLSTVLWVATREKAGDANAAVPLVYSWNARKRQFSGRQILLAFKVLDDQGWLRARA
jgi:O-acetyl-ADP-ribose deacetylase (regulator of RNase III)